MKLWERSVTGSLLAACVHGPLCGVSVLIAIHLHKKWGWSLFGVMLVLSTAFSLAATPLTTRIQRRFSKAAE